MLAVGAVAAVFAAGCGQKTDISKGIEDFNRTLEPNGLTLDCPKEVKGDLVAQWDIRASDLEAMKRRCWTVVRTSAKTGEGVEDAFAALVDNIAPVKSWL